MYSQLCPATSGRLLPFSSFASAQLHVANFIYYVFCLLFVGDLLRGIVFFEPAAAFLADALALALDPELEGDVEARHDESG
jgi:hypothetical protein